MSEESLKILTPEELESIAITKGINIDESITKENLQTFIDNAINKVEGLSNLPINPTKNKEIRRNFSANRIILDNKHLIQIEKITLDGKQLELRQYPHFIDAGVVYFDKKYRANFLIIEYVTRVSQDFYDKKIAPLLEELLLYHINDDPHKDYSTIKEGDVSVQYSGRKDSPLDIIENKIESLADGPIARMI